VRVGLDKKAFSRMTMGGSRSYIIFMLTELRSRLPSADSNAHYYVSRTQSLSCHIKVIMHISRPSSSEPKDSPIKYLLSEVASSSAASNSSKSP
jgi:hypothetical protein